MSKQIFKLFSKHDKCSDNTEEMLQERKHLTNSCIQKKNNNKTNKQTKTKKPVCDVKIEDYVPSLPKLTENEADFLEGFIIT